MRALAVRRLVVCVGALSMAAMAGCASMQSGGIAKPSSAVKQELQAAAPQVAVQFPDGSPEIGRLSGMASSGQVAQALGEAHLIWQAGPIPDDVVPLALFFARTYDSHKQPDAAIDWVKAALARAKTEGEKDLIMKAVKSFSSKDPLLLAVIDINTPQAQVEKVATAQSQPREEKVKKKGGREGYREKGKVAKADPAPVKESSGKKRSTSKSGPTRELYAEFDQKLQPEGQSMTDADSSKKRAETFKAKIRVTKAEPAKGSIRKNLPETAGQSNEVLKVIHLRGIPRSLAAQLRNGRTEAGKVWMLCSRLTLKAQKAGAAKPGLAELEKAAEGKFNLDNQSVRMVCEAFVNDANGASKSKNRYALTWPGKAVAAGKDSVSLPMGQGGDAIELHGMELPENAGGYRIVWNNRYELHVMVGHPVTGTVAASEPVSKETVAKVSVDGAQLASANRVPVESRQISHGKADPVGKKVDASGKKADQGTEGPSSKPEGVNVKELVYATLNETRRQGSAPAGAPPTTPFE